jgi:hypothetical protein
VDLCSLAVLALADVVLVVLLIRSTGLSEVGGAEGGAPDTVIAARSIQITAGAIDALGVRLQPVWSAVATARVAVSRYSWSRVGRVRGVTPEAGTTASGSRAPPIGAVPA